MAKNAGLRGARPVVKLLGDQAATIDLELMKEALNALGKPYSQLTAPGRDRPKIDRSDGLASVLNRLRTAGIVSKFEEKNGRLEVSKRHS
ncbi:hypothetical protein [Gordonia polyisoprenivorans]|uniref:hypothetical protein n=1 Tax=Gordonia polyisoprenivorans TaxID=84595 RepID=UPI00105493A2|nr:hypothetical protein [Gordonia polyisoprenivorans]